MCIAYCDSTFFNDITLSVTGPLVGYYNSDSQYLKVTLQYYGDNGRLSSSNFCKLPDTNGASGIATSCPTEFTYTHEQINAGTASARLCMQKTLSDYYTVVALYIRIDTYVRGACFQLYDTVNQVYYTVRCYSQSGSTYFFSERAVMDNQPLATINTNRVGDSKVYIDYYSSSVIRPEISVTLQDSDAFSVPINNDDMTSPYLKSVYYHVENDQDIGLSFNTNQLLFGGTIDLQGSESVDVTIKNGADSSTISSRFTISRFKCDESAVPAQYPVIFTRVYSTSSNYEVFTLSVNGNVVGSTKLSTDDWTSHLLRGGPGVSNVVAEYAVCLEASSSQYQLEMSTVDTNGNVLTAISWNTDSYLTISVLSQTVTSDTSKSLTGYIVGDFGFTATYTESGNVNSISQSATINVDIGPMICQSEERVVIFDKLATVSGGSEGFEIYTKDVINNEVTLKNSYFGLASFASKRFDPFFRVFLCLQNKQTYEIRLRSYPVATTSAGVYQYASCTAWSTSNSVEAITYTDVYTDSVVTQVHPSMMYIRIVDDSSYYGGDLPTERVYASYEGSKYAVINNDSIDRHDLLSSTLCTYNFDIFIVQPAAFTVSDSTGNDIPAAGVTVMEGQNYDFKFLCTDMSDSTPAACTVINTYSLSCYTSTDSGVTKTVVNCADYGFILDSTATSYTAGVTGRAANPNDAAFTFYATVTSVPSATTAEYYSGVSSTYMLTVTKNVNMADAYVTTQGSTLNIPSKDNIVNVDTEVVCTLNNVVIPHGSNTIDISLVSGNALYQFAFSISSYTPFVCTIGQKVVRIYSRPICSSLSGGDSNTMSSVEIPLNNMIESTCNTDGYYVQQYCVYNEMTLRAEIYTKNIPCILASLDQGVDLATVPSGHAYTQVHAILELDEALASGDDISFLNASGWFFEEILSALKEAFSIPIRDIYMTRRMFTSDSSNYRNEYDFVIDSQFGTSNAVSEVLIDAEFADNLKNILASVDPEIFTTRYFSFQDVITKENSAKCKADTANVPIIYYPNNITSNPVSVVLENVPFEETEVFYYAYTPVPDSIEQNYNGKITRLCKPEYFGSYFDKPSTNSVVQIINMTWWDLPMVVYIDGLDPRAANFDVRYALQRTLMREVYNQPDGAYTHYTRDVNVYNIEGISIQSESPLVYGGTSFNVVLRVKDTTEIRGFYNYMNSNVCDKASRIRGHLFGDWSNTILESMQKLIGKTNGEYIFKIDDKTVRIYLPDYYDEEKLPAEE
ncbi:hypothetical protein WA158_002240 [Blastocystis sp. Blastoise]